MGRFKILRSMLDSVFHQIPFLMHCEENRLRYPMEVQPVHLYGICVCKELQLSSPPNV